MARNRMIKKEFWNDEKVGKLLDRGARLTFVGIWNLCDDIGICRASPSFIRSQLYPYDKNLTDSMIEAEIKQMIVSKLAIKATYKGEEYLKVKHFLRHQAINRPSKSYTIAGLDKSNIDKLFEETSTDSVGAGESLPSIEETVAHAINEAFGESDEDAVNGDEDLNGEITYVPEDDAPSPEWESTKSIQTKQKKPSFRLPSSDSS